jgi:hypothetical protein
MPGVQVQMVTSSCGAPITFWVMIAMTFLLGFVVAYLGVRDAFR